MNSQLRIVFFGTPDFVLPVAKSLKENFDLVGIVTSPDAIQGRKKELTPSPVKEFATQNSISVFTFEDYDDHAVEQLKKLEADIFVVAAYGVIVPQTVLDLPKKGALNIHPSLLPKYRGPSPIQTALLNGDKESGITIIQMDADVDHGPIISQWKFPIANTDTFEKLHYAMFENAAKKLPQIIDDYTEQEIKPVIQNHDAATFCEKITRESGYFDSNNPPSPTELDRMIRAYYPWPNAWTKLQTLNGHMQIVKFFPEEKIQMEGKNIATRKEFLNGYPELKEKINSLFEEK